MNHCAESEKNLFRLGAGDLEHATYELSTEQVVSGVNRRFTCADSRPKQPSNPAVCLSWAFNFHIYGNYKCSPQLLFRMVANDATIYIRWNTSESKSCTFLIFFVPLHGSRIGLMNILGQHVLIVDNLLWTSVSRAAVEDTSVTIRGTTQRKQPIWLLGCSVASGRLRCGPWEIHFRETLEGMNTQRK